MQMCITGDYKKTIHCIIDIYEVFPIASNDWDSEL